MTGASKADKLGKKAIVVGSGVGGLSMGIILAQLGLEVLILEKNRQPGGMIRSYVRDGIHCDVGVHYLGSLDKGQALRRMFDYLGIREAIPVTKMGQGYPIDRYIFNHKTNRHWSFDLPEGIDTIEERLREAFPQEARSLQVIFDLIRQAAKQLHNLDILYSAETTFSLLDQAEPMGKLLSDLNCSPDLKSILALPTCWLGVPINDCPIYYHNTAFASYASSSWRLKNNGAHLADVFASRLKELGGQIYTEQEVASLLVESRVVKGVRLASGEELYADTVIGAVHPQNILNMLAPGDVKPSYRKRIQSLENTHGICSTHVRIESETCKELPYNLFSVETDQRGNIDELYYFQVRSTEKEGVNLLSILSSGRDDLWEPWLQTTSGQRGAEYLARKYTHAQALLAQAESMLGHLPGAKIIDAYTPLSIRDWVYSPGGSAYGVLRSTSRQLATAMLNRTAIQGLYLAGQNTLAPGVVGTLLGSFNTVKLMLGHEEFAKNIQV